MSDKDEDDKPTVVLDLNALKKQKLAQEEELNTIVQELEFTTEAMVGPTSETKAPEKKQAQPTQTVTGSGCKVILFDFQTDFFETNKKLFPLGYSYHIAKDLNALNQHLKSKNFQIVVFNYDVNPKAVNQLCAQIKSKLPSTKTVIMARAISPEKAKVHAATASGANGYYQFPLDANKIEKEFLKVQGVAKKAAS